MARKIAYCTLLCLAIESLFFLFAIDSRIQSSTESEVSSGQIENKIFFEQRQVRDRKEKLNTAELLISDYDDKILPEESKLLFQRRLEVLSKSAGVKDTAVKTISYQNLALKDSVSFELKTKSDFKTFLQLLRDLESEKIFVKCYSVQTQKGIDSGNEIIDSTILLAVPIRKTK